MAKASITLESGALVAIEGTVEEIQKLLSVYGKAKGDSSSAPSGPAHASRQNPNPVLTGIGKGKGKLEHHTSVDLLAIVNHIKSCDEAALIGTHILDRVGQSGRVILPLYIVHEHLGNSPGLTSGDISKITIDLGIPMAVGNVSNMLAGPVSKYVVGDKVRKHGQPVRYKLSRLGRTYFKIVNRPEKLTLKGFSNYEAPHYLNR